MSERDEARIAFAGCMRSWPCSEAGSIAQVLDGYIPPSAVDSDSCVLVYYLRVERIPGATLAVVLDHRKGGAWDPRPRLDCQGGEKQ